MIQFRSVKPMRTAKIGYIIMSVLMGIIGLGLIIFPNISVNIFSKILGVIFVIFGLIKIIGYFSKDLYRLAFQYDLAYGLLMIILGIIMILRNKNILIYLCVTLGIIILADGLFKIQISLDAKLFGLTHWLKILILALFAVGFGLILILQTVNSGTGLTVLVGVSLLVEGLLNCFTVITSVKIIKNQKPDNIDKQL